MDWRLRMAAIAMAFGPMTGCGFVADNISNQTTAAGPKPLSVPYEEVHLPYLLDPENYAQAEYGAGWDDLPEGKKIDLAFHAFHTRYPAETERARRDQIQERLLGISNQMCSRYLSYMQNINSDGNFVLGSLATIAGAAGAIFTGGTSQILAGTAGALSGVRAEFNQDYFSNLTVAVITSGINLKRQEIYDEIVRFGAERNERRYTVEAAVKDALFYHGECSLMAGVEKAGDAIKLAQDPGLDAVNRTLIKVNQMRMIAQDQVTDPSLVPGLRGNTLKLLQAGKPTGSLEEDLDDLPSVVLSKLKLQAAKLKIDTADKLEAIAGFKVHPNRSIVDGALTNAQGAVAGKIDACSKDAQAATAKIVDALGAQAAADSDVQRQAAQSTLRSAVLAAEAVNVKARLPVSIFDQNLKEALLALVEADRKAREANPPKTIDKAELDKAAALIKQVESVQTGCS